MFDTIHIELPNQYIDNLKTKSDTIDRETGEVKYSVGYSDCIKVREVRGVIIIECSLSKLLKGNNIYSLDFFEVILALQLIEKKLGVSIMKGIIRRLDCEITIETHFKPNVYFRYLGNSKYFLRKEFQKTSLYYSNSSRVINIYDKIKERKDKKELIPIECEGKNLFRFECRYRNAYLKSIAKKNYLEILKVEDLINPQIFKNLTEIVFNEYEAITKFKKNVIPNLGNSLKSKSDLINFIAAFGIEALGGINEVQEMIDASRPFNPNMRKEYFSRRKKDIKEIATSLKIEYLENLISEIDQKIKETHHLRLKSIEKCFCYEK